MFPKNIKTILIMKNTPLTILIIGLTFVSILVAFNNPGTQKELINYLGLENTNTPTQSKAKVAGAKIERGKVQKVTDGDTITLDTGRTVRYLNVDTPETKKPGTAVQCYGPEASKFNKELVDGKEVLLVSDKESEDRYGRDLRFVFLSDQNTDNMENSVNAKLVKLGYARSISYKPNTTYTKFFDELAAKPKEQKIGVWSCPSPFEQ